MLSAQWDVDAQIIYNQIMRLENKEEIIAMYLRGPPEDTGFLWWDDPCAKQVGNIILSKGYESSAYGMMHRSVQKIIHGVYKNDVPN